MFGNRLGFAFLAIGCLAAAGVGGYVASRQNVVTSAPVAASTPPVATGRQAVQETEGLVGNSTAGSATESKTRQAPPAAAERNTAPASRGPSKTAKPQTPALVAQNNQPQTLDRSWPSSAQPPAAAAPSGFVAPDTNAARQEELRAAEPPATPEPPAKTFDELVIAPNSVVGLQMETAISSEHARVEDRVEARVIRDVRVAGQVAVPAGSRAIGTVMTVETGGKFKERARLGIRFQTLVLGDGSQIPITTETIYRYGEAPGNGSAAKVGGGAVAGAILGALLGGAKGAAVGSAAGAGAGTAAVMAGGPNPATFAVGAEVTARFVSPVTITVER